MGLKQRNLSNLFGQIYKVIISHNLCLFFCVLRDGNVS